jgi:DNA-binding beta-propeller fold protein YncE
VFDSDTGKFKRGWGAYGKPLSEIDNNPQPPHDPKGPPAAQFKSPVHCVRISNDGLLYVCDRAGDRIQVFTKQGKFLKEFFIANETLRGGSAGSVDFSPDPGQKYIFVADIVNNVVWELERETGKIVDKIGHHGHAGGQFHFVHVATMDSKGNLYTGEVDSGKRVQKFVPVRN